MRTSPVPLRRPEREGRTDPEPFRKILNAAHNLQFPKKEGKEIVSGMRYGHKVAADFIWGWRGKKSTQGVFPRILLFLALPLFQWEGDDLKASRDGIDIKSFSFPKVKRFFNGLLRTSLPQFRGQ